MAARALSDADPVEAIVRIMAAAFDPQFGEAWTRRQVSDALLLGSCRYGFVDRAGRCTTEATDAVGFFLSRRVIDEEELLLFAISPEYRGHGLGAALLEDFLRGAGAGGVTRAFLEMRAGNSAERLYRAHGFASIGVRPAYYRGSDGARRDAISFERLLR